MTNETARPAKEFLWNLLSVVELTYHPALAVALLFAIDVAMSTVPVLTLNPVSVAVTAEGIPVTTLFAGVALVDLVCDVVKVSTTEWVTAKRDHQ